jgi:Asp-tRNA(Asn)/Glu-tRNA(Gln) amidotransferase B subunit
VKTQNAINIVLAGMIELIENERFNKKMGVPCMTMLSDTEGDPKQPVTEEDLMLVKESITLCLATDEVQNMLNKSLRLQTIVKKD